MPPRWMPWAEVGVSAVLGLGDAAFAAWDHHVGLSADPLERTATWYQLTLLALGGVGEIVGAPEVISRPMLLVGATLLTRQASFGVSADSAELPAPARAALAVEAPGVL